MKQDKLIPSLIEEDNTSLPERGGKYVSDEEKERKELKKAKKELEEKRRCDCNCHCDCNCDDCDSHPFFSGEGSC